MSFPVRDECSHGRKYAEVGYYVSGGSRSCKQCHLDRRSATATGDPEPEKERCVNGHVYAEVGWYVRPHYDNGKLSGRKRIDCRGCVLARQQRYYQKGEGKERQIARRAKEQAQRLEVQRAKDRARHEAKRRAAGIAPRALSVVPVLPEVRFSYRHPESGRFASVLFQEIPAGIFDIAARRNWSQQPEMIGWLYLMWKFHLPSWSAAERMEFNEFMAWEAAA